MFLQSKGIKDSNLQLDKSVRILIEAFLPLALRTTSWLVASLNLRILLFMKLDCRLSKRIPRLKFQQVGFPEEVGGVSLLSHASLVTLLRFYIPLANFWFLASRSTRSIPLELPL